MKRFSIVTTTFNEYELTRQLIESILCNIDRDTYDKIIISDDFSQLDGKLRQYLVYLKNNYDFIDVILQDKALGSMYNKWRSSGDGQRCAGGPVIALLRGVERVNTEFTLNIDCDTILLKKSKNILVEMANYFDTYPEVAIMGQVGVDRTPYKVYKDAGKNWDQDPPKLGTPSPMANAVRMSIIREGGINYVFSDHKLYEPIRANWNISFLIRGIYAAKLHTMNFPLFGDLYMVHVGGAVSNLQREDRKGRKFGYCNEPVHYEGRHGNKISDWYSGRMIVNKTHQEYLNYLKETYSKPFEDIQLIDEKMFKTID